MGEKAKIRAYDGMFLNSKSIFIEYNDIIKSPYFMILLAMAATTMEILKPFDLTNLKKMEFSDILDFYYTRNHVNPLMDLIAEDSLSDVHEKDVDEFLNRQVTSEILENSQTLNFVTVINTLYRLNPNMAGTVYVWYPYKNEYVDNDIKTTLSDVETLKILNGPIEECLKDIPNDSTFIFSDITNINALVDTGKIDFSSIIIAEDYNYNRIDGEYKINFDELIKRHIFKLDRCLASITIENEDVEEEENDN